MNLRGAFKTLVATVFVTIFLWATQPSSGQAVNGTLLGTITDATGAAVGGARIMATQTSTGALHEATTNESGNYTFPDMQPGTLQRYRGGEGIQEGHPTERRPGQQFRHPRRHLTLQTGDVSETIMVTTAPPVLQTDRADISTKLETQDIVDMPLGTNRNFQSLINLVPGAAPATFQHSQFFNAASSLQTEVNGLPRQGNLYQIEGVDDDERTGLLQIIIPPAESISAVDISTNNFEAELGRATGAVTNVMLKSGTNSYHGGLFEYIQNNDLNARSYFGGPLGHLSYNYFGGSVGGPIIKDKLFIFGDYLHTSDHESVASTFTIPDSRYITNAGLTPGCSDPTGCIDLSGAVQRNQGPDLRPRHRRWTNYASHSVHE